MTQDRPATSAEQNPESRPDQAGRRRLRQLRFSQAVWFRCLAILVGVSPLLLLEGWLRFREATDRALATRLALQRLPSAEPLFRLDADNRRWQIPPDRFGYFRPASFAHPKPPGGRRVFVLGGSTVQGRPFSTETAFSTFIGIHLEQCTSIGPTEVVNVGGISYASDRLAAISGEVLRHQPDAIILMTGHNEFLSERTDQAAAKAKNRQGWADQIADRWRTLRWLQGDWSAPSSETPDFIGEVETRLDRPGGLSEYVRDPVWKQHVVDSFATNLRSIATACRKARVPLLVVAPASDTVRTPPFKVQADPSLPEETRRQVDRWWQQVTSDIGGAEQSDQPNRNVLLKKMLAVDSGHAGAHYLLARRRMANSISNRPRDTTTVAHLIAARDYDVCPLRATTPILNQIKSVADDFQVPIVDVSDLFDPPPGKKGHPHDEIAEPGWFVDHVHPTVTGHRRIAYAVMPWFESLGWCNWDEPARRRGEDAVDHHLNSLGEAYYARGRQRLEGLRRWAAGRAGLSDSP